jgi:hypothetical protein
VLGWFSRRGAEALRKGKSRHLTPTALRRGAQKGWPADGRSNPGLVVRISAAYGPLTIPFINP